MSKGEGYSPFPLDMFLPFVAHTEYLVSGTGTTCCSALKSLNEVFGVTILFNTKLTHQFHPFFSVSGNTCSRTCLEK